MRIAVLVTTLIAFLALPQVIRGQGCRIAGIDRESAKTGETLSATGEDIGKKSVDELYLTDGTNDFKVAIVEQNDGAIKFKVPDKVKAGRYSLMIKTAGANPRLLEQPVKVNIEE